MYYNSNLVRARFGSRPEPLSRDNETVESRPTACLLTFLRRLAIHFRPSDGVRSQSMISLDEYARYDALGLAELIAKKQLKPEELLTVAYLAIAKVNPAVNAVVQTFPEPAAKAIKAGLKQGPFRGVPLLIKEMTLQAKNVPCNMGSRFAQGFTPTEDSNLMSRFRRAGFVLAGTTSVPEFGCSPTTEPVLYGPTRNPWNITRIAGGSSGGSAAAVASGMVPIAHGGDGAGSIRQPASCTGLVGLKPSRDRIPTGPALSDPLCGMSAEFAFTRTVRDAAALLDAVSGADVGAPGHPVPPARRYLDELKQKPNRLRIAWSVTNPSGGEVDAECKKAVQETVKLLLTLGHEVVEDYPRYDWETYIRSLHIIFCVNTAAVIESIGTAMNRKPGPDNLEVATLASYEHGRRYTAVDLLNALAHGNTLSRKVGAFFEQVDVFITPTMPRVPAPLGELNQNRAGMGAMDWTRQAFGYVPFTPIFNTTGQPAMSLPLHMTPDGLPVGVQLASRFGEESTLFRLAAQLEQARPWSARKPPAHCTAVL